MNSFVNSAHGGNGWEGRRTKHVEELSTNWGNCGVASETDVLKHVLLRTPGREIEKIDFPEVVLWDAKMDVTLAREQHCLMAEKYRENGVTIDFIKEEDANIYPNIIYVRDTFTMTPEGAIISRLASAVRAGEERLVAKTLMQIDIPIIASAYSDMCLEGPDVVLVNCDLVFLGVGLRTNLKAVMFVKHILEIQGFNEIHIIQTTYGCGHLDGVFNLLNNRNATIIPKRASFEIYSVLKRHGFNIIELNNLYEVDTLMSINFVPINNEMIFINKGAKETVAIYESCGVECVEIDVSELTKGGGSIHCMTGILRRDKV